MRKGFFLALVLLAGLTAAGCSTKQMNDTADSVGSDIKNFVDRATEQH